MSGESLLDLRVADAVTLLAVHRHGSVTTAARDLRVTASQVSKAVTRLERHLGVRLFVRRGRGLILTAAGMRALPRLQSIVDSARALFDGERAARLSIAAPSYICQAYLPALAIAAAPLMIRGLEALPSFIRAYAGEGLFDIALTHAREPLPPSWSSEEVGRVRHGLFTTRATAEALGRAPTPDDLRPLPFVTPVYVAGGEILMGEDRCPIPRADRVTGHEASTIAAGLELAATTGQIVCGPRVAARRHLESGRLVELQVAGWDLIDPLFLHVNGDEVTRRTKAQIDRALADLAH